MKTIINNKLIIITALILFFISSTIAQNITNVNVSANFIDTDSQNNIFLVNGKLLQKYDTNGKLLYQYSNAFLGNISAIDVTNHLKILLFYYNTQTIVFLNRQLAIIGSPINLNNLTYNNVQLACNNIDGGFWVFEQSDNTLVNYSLSMVKTHQSNSIISYFNNQNPLFLIQAGQNLYLSLTNKVLVFDLYGTYINTIQINSTTKPSITQSNIFYYNEHGYFKHNTITNNTTKININNTIGIIDVKPLQNGYCLMLENKLSITQHKQ